MSCTVKTEDPLLTQLKAYMEQLKGQPRSEAALIAILHKAQELCGYVSREAMDEIALTMNIPTAHIWGVATFYHHFKLKQPGKHIVSLCLGTACYIKGAGEVLDRLKEELKTDIGGMSPDGIFSLEEARCLGACGLAPVMMVDGKIYGSLTPKKVTEILNAYRKQDQGKDA
jgi:NADH:ubiquinone oxidoreductase subunit E